MRATTTLLGRAPVRHDKVVDGATHFLTKGLECVKTEMSLHVLAYNFMRLMMSPGVVYEK